MKEYYGVGARTYAITERKQHILFPAIDRALPQATSGARLLDMACGNGAFYDVVSAKGYKYIGLDISDDMVDEAKKRHPVGQYVVADARTFTDVHADTYDVILSVLLLPSLSTYDDLVTTLTHVKKALKPNGRVILGTTHPCFDQYMQTNLLGRKDVKTNFSGYFARGVKFEFVKDFPEGQFTFEDYHYTLADYVSAIAAAGLTISSIDECSPSDSLRHTDSELYEKYSRFPGYMVIVCS